MASPARRGLEEITHLPAGVWSAPHICVQTIQTRGTFKFAGWTTRRQFYSFVVVHIQSTCVLLRNPDEVVSVGMAWGFSLN